MRRSLMKLFLFDLDGTLVNTGGAGLRALDRTFEQMYNMAGVMTRVDPSGKTDPAIFSEIIRIFLERPIEPNELKLISSTYLKYLSIEVRYSKAYRVLEGVEPFISYLMTRGDILLGLGTGNLEAGARIKLMRSGLNPYFPFGGFGSDTELRPNLLRQAHQRGERRCRQSISPDNVFVIGDTALDIKAAHEAGYRAVAVANGSHSKEELELARPEFLFPDLTHGFSFLKSIGTSGAGVIS